MKHALILENLNAMKKEDCLSLLRSLDFQTFKPYLENMILDNTLSNNVSLDLKRLMVDFYISSNLYNNHITIDQKILDIWLKNKIESFINIPFSEIDLEKPLKMQKTDCSLECLTFYNSELKFLHYHFDKSFLNYFFRHITFDFSNNTQKHFNLLCLTSEERVFIGFLDGLKIFLKKDINDSLFEEYLYNFYDDYVFVFLEDKSFISILLKYKNKLMSYLDELYKNNFNDFVISLSYLEEIMNTETNFIKKLNKNKDNSCISIKQQNNINEFNKIILFYKLKSFQNINVYDDKYICPNICFHYGYEYADDVSILSFFENNDDLRNKFFFLNLKHKYHFDQTIYDRFLDNDCYLFLSNIEIVLNSKIDNPRKHILDKIKFIEKELLTNNIDITQYLKLIFQSLFFKDDFLLIYTYFYHELLNRNNLEFLIKNYKKIVDLNTFRLKSNWSKFLSLNFKK